MQKIELRNYLASIKVDSIHHGDCIGADVDFLVIGSEFTNDVKVHPPKKELFRANSTMGVILPAKEYLQRNKDIVDSSDLLIACPSGTEERLRSGTWSTLRYAKNKGKKYLIIYPDGIKGGN